MRLSKLVAVGVMALMIAMMGPVFAVDSKKPVKVFILFVFPRKIRALSVMKDQG